MWSYKYRPKRIEEMVGNEDARSAFLNWLTNWKVGTKPILLVGPPGVGKTTLVKAAADQLGFDIIEMNASDVRTKERIESVINPILSNVSVTGKHILLFLDEVDGISGTADRGGFASLISILKQPSIPIAMAANTETGEQIKELKKVSTIIKFKSIPPRLLLLYLNHVLEEEGVNRVSIGEKINVIVSCKGDMRMLLNEVQAVYSTGVKGSEHSISSIEISNSINKFFSAKSAKEAINALQRSEGFYYDPRFGGYGERRRLDKLYALFSSIVTSNKDPDTLASMLKVISDADLIIGRMNKNMQWRMLRYIDTLLALGLFKYSKGVTYNQYDVPFILMNRVFREASMFRDFVEGLSHKLHVSKRRFVTDYLPYMIMILAASKIELSKFLYDNDMNQAIQAIIESEAGRRVKKKVDQI